MAGGLHRRDDVNHESIRRPELAQSFDITRSSAAEPVIVPVVILNPKPEGVEQMDAIRRATATARRLERMIEEIDGLNLSTMRATLDSLEALREDLTDLLERTKAQYAKSA